MKDEQPCNQTTTTEDQCWSAFVAASRAWAEHMDQWDKIKFTTPSGPVYVTIGRSDPYPDSFEEVP